MNKSRRMNAVSIIFLTVLLCGCNLSNESDLADESKISIVATLFPQYDFAKQVAGEYADVSLLLPPGVESHAYDPKPGDIATIYASDMFLYTGSALEPWAERIIQSLDKKELTVVDVTEGVTLFDSINEDDNEEDHGSHEHGADAHVWLDPVNCLAMVDNIAEALADKDPAHAKDYKANAEAYKEKLRKLDDDFAEMINDAKRDTVVFGGRFAYIYFLSRYDLKYETAYQTCSMEAEPSIQQITTIIRFIKDNAIPCVYHEEFVDPKVAESIANETGATPLLFSTAHNVTKDELLSGITYIDIMMNNLENLKIGLN